MHQRVEIVAISIIWHYSMRRELENIRAAKNIKRHIGVIALALIIILARPDLLSRKSKPVSSQYRIILPILRISL